MLNVLLKEFFLLLLIKSRHSSYINQRRFIGPKYIEAVVLFVFSRFSPCDGR